MGVGKVDLEKFLADHPTILIRRQFDPTSPRYSLSEVANFIESFKERNQHYTLTLRNCQKFAVDFSEHFFDIRFLSQSKLLRRVSRAMGVVGGAVGMLGFAGYLVF